MGDPWSGEAAFPSSGGVFSASFFGEGTADTLGAFGALRASIETRPELGSASPQMSRKKVLCVRVQGWKNGGNDGVAGH